MLKIDLYPNNKAHHSSITGFEKFPNIDKHKDLPIIVENLQKYCGNAIIDDKSRA